MLQLAFGHVGLPSPPMEPAEALERIVYLLDRAREKPYRVRAYLRAAQIVKALAPDELVARVAAGTLEELDGIGPKTAAIITEVATTGSTAYLDKLDKETALTVSKGNELVSQLKCRSRKAVVRVAASAGDAIDGGTQMSVTVCLTPAQTIEYPEGGGHLWVYLNWALGLRARGCRVIWLEGIDLGDKATARRRRHGTDARTCLATLKARLEPYGFADAIALFPLGDEPLPLDLTEGCLDLDAAAEADLLLTLWHSLPAPVVGRFRRSAFVDTDPGLLQIWMTTGELDVARPELYFAVGATAVTPAAEFPDCGLRWQYTPPPVFLPEWPLHTAVSGAPYTTIAHWWGGTVHFAGQRLSNDKLVGFLEYAHLPM